MNKRRTRHVAELLKYYKALVATLTAMSTLVSNHVGKVVNSCQICSSL